MENQPSGQTSGRREIDMNNRRNLEKQINGATSQELSRYHSLLNAIRRNRLDKEKPGPVQIPIEERLKLIEMAKSDEDIAVLTKPPEGTSVDPIKMKEKWEAATDQNNGRPPIGGAVDD